jgi:hypothetical protein
MRPLPAIAAIVAVLCITVVFAAPAPWYKWRSKLTGDETCAQVMQGEWERVSGPYKDSRCQIPGIPGSP